jgi:hypothetical protein
MINLTKIKNILQILNALTLLGTIISLFFNSWKISLFLVILYITISDFYIVVVSKINPLDEVLNKIIK